MATPLKLKALEAERGDLHKVIPPLVNTHGQTEAARILRISPATVSTWLKANHYRPRTIWEQEPA